MDNEKNSNEELNYKQAYYYLFNQITNITKWLRFIQGNAEKICVDELSEQPELPEIEKVLEELIKNIENDGD